MVDFLASEAVLAFFSVVMIDLTLAGDNAVVIGMAAAGLPALQRGRAILIGIIVATVLRIGFALVAVELLDIVGLLLAGGLLLMWVAWKMWQELRVFIPDIDDDAMLDSENSGKTLMQAVTQIVIADVSMSLDNVLAVAGAAHEHPTVLIFGLVFSIFLMGVMSVLIAKLLHKHRWIAYVGLLIILFVALRMVWHGAHDVIGVMG
jgi:YjbE family integral membrane protein